MKKTIIVSVLMILCMGSMAQTNWTQVNCNLLPGQGVGQISIGMEDNTTLWAYATDGPGGLPVERWTRSLDGGLTWNSGTFNAGVGMSQLFALDGGACWAVFNTGASQGLYKTINGGTTWEKKGGVYGSSSYADVIHFFTFDEGVAIGDPVGGYNEIYTTTDAGETWSRVPQANIPAPISGEFAITGNYSAVGNNIWFGTNKGRVYRSVDKGYHWNVSLTAFGNTVVVKPVFADALHGLVHRSYLDLGLETELNVTSDGGATWSSVVPTGNFYGHYVSHIPGTSNTYVGSSEKAGENGISVSYDGGYNWSVISQGYDFTATVWIDTETGWAGSIASAKKSVASTGGMYIYNGPALAPNLPLADFQADATAVASGGVVHFSDLSTGTPTGWSWTFAGGTPASSALKTPPPVTYNTPGSFNVTLTVTNANGTNTKVKTNYIYVGGVGMNDHTASDAIVSPNPARDHINITCGDGIQQISIFDVSGKERYSGVDSTIDIRKFQPGIYFMKILTGKGRSTIKLMKE